MKITENDIRQMVSESVERVLREGMFDESYFGETMFDEKKSKKHHSKSHSESHSDEKHNDKETHSKRRQRVISYLKQDGVDVAQYAYELWPDKDEDSGRSYFYKCLNGETNDSGVPYRFSDDEVNRLYSMISSASI